MNLIQTIDLAFSRSINFEFVLKSKMDRKSTNMQLESESNFNKEDNSQIPNSKESLTTNQENKGKSIPSRQGSQSGKAVTKKKKKKTPANSK